MKIVVIEDERPTRGELIYLIRQSLEKRGAEAVILEAASGKAAIELLAEEEPDLVFLDIHLGDIEGTVLASMIRRSHPDAQIVFATAYNDHAEKAFDVKALNYILKPYDGARVDQTLDRYFALEEKAGTAGQEPPLTRISIPTEKKLVVVNVDDIVYLETVNRKCIIHTRSGEIASTGTISAYEERLKGSGFFRIQKSYLINLKYVVEVYPWVNNCSCVKLSGYEKEVLTVSREKLRQLKELLDT